MSDPHLRTVLITQGLSPIVGPMVELGYVVGIAEARPRQNKEQRSHDGQLLRRARRRLALRFHPGPLAEYARSHSVPYRFMENGCDADFQAWMRERYPDLLVVYSMSELLPASVFSLPSRGSINLHPSLLPKYRGPNPYFWALFNAEQSHGVTIHFIDEGEDTGDVIYQQEFPIEPGMSVADLRDATLDLGVPLLVRAVKDIRAGVAPRLAQPGASPTKRARLVKPNEHHSLVDWVNWPKSKILDLFERQVLPLNHIVQTAMNRSDGSWKVTNTDEHTRWSVLKPGTAVSSQGEVFLICRDGAIVMVEQTDPLLRRFFRLPGILHLLSAIPFLSDFARP